MAIIMTTKNSWTVLHNILGDGQAYQKAQYLQTLGAEVVVGMFSVQITVGGATFEDKMPIALTNFSTADKVEQSLVRLKVALLLEKALIHSATHSAKQESTDAGPNPCKEIFSTPPVEAPEPAGKPAWMNSIPVPAKEVKAAQSIAGLTTLAHSESQEATKDSNTGFTAWQAQNAPVPPATPIKLKPVPGVVKLKDARALSQKVSGTSSGSVYRVAAVGKVNIAIREQPGVVSVRAEFQKKSDPDSINKLTALGFSENSSYLSMHITLTNGAPAMRVVGSILLGAGLEFEQIATTSEQING